MKSKNLFGLFVFILISCSNRAQEKASENAETFAQSISSGNVQLLDVRTIDEYNSGHLKNALQADWLKKDEFRERTKHLDKDRPLYLYCLSGARSAQAADFLRKEGFHQVVNLEGGINAWRTAGQPMEAVKEVPQMSTEEYRKLTSSFSLVMVDVGAEWCPPCKKMEPVIQHFQTTQASRVMVVKVDGGTQTRLLKDLKVEAMPTFILYKAGKEVWRKQGIISEDELVSVIEKY